MKEVYSPVESCRLRGRELVRTKIRWTTLTNLAGTIGTVQSHHQAHTNGPEMHLVGVKRIGHAPINAGWLDKPTKTKASSLWHEARREYISDW